MEAHQEHQKSWFSRNKLWAIPTGGCLIIIVLIAIFVVSLVGGVTTLFSKSEPYQYALEQAQQSEWVTSKIGQPIETDGMTTGNVNYSDGESTAELKIQVKGNKDEAVILVIANKSADQWVYETLTITIDDSKEVYNLLTKEVVTGKEE
ncbi:MAG: cytochrome c oxidase assembly factor Coa1 family protein [Gilvibacter sp.]